MLSCEIREEPLQLISVRRCNDRPAVFPWLHCANVGSRGHSSLRNTSSIASLGSLPYQGRAGSQWPSVDSRLVAHVKPGHKVVDRAQSRRLRVILWQLSAFQSCSNRRQKPVNASGPCLDSKCKAQPEQTVQWKGLVVDKSERKVVGREK